MSASNPDSGFVLVTSQLDVDGVDTDVHAYTTDALGWPLSQLAAQSAGEAIALAAQAEGGSAQVNPNPVTFEVFPAEQVPAESAPADAFVDADRAAASGASVRHPSTAPGKPEREPAGDADPAASEKPDEV